MYILMERHWCQFTEKVIKHGITFEKWQNKRLKAKQKCSHGIYAPLKKIWPLTDSLMSSLICLIFKDKDVTEFILKWPQNYNSQTRKKNENVSHSIGVFVDYTRLLRRRSSSRWEDSTKRQRYLQKDNRHQILQWGFCQ